MRAVYDAQVADGGARFFSLACLHRKQQVRSHRWARRARSTAAQTNNALALAAADAGSAGFFLSDDNVTALVSPTKMTRDDQAAARNYDAFLLIKSEHKMKLRDELTIR